MISTPPRALAAAGAFLAAIFLIGIAFAQDKPDRPPWAQPKPKLPANSSSADATAPVPPTLPSPSPPGSIVPTPERPLKPPEDADAQRDRIKVKVELVNILASVLDEHNRPAPDLPVEAFQVFEEGVAQKIEVFESETKLPLDLALMIDSSLSANMEIGFEKEAAAHFIRQVLRPGDRLSVFAFDENVTQRAAFSDDVPNLQAAVRKIPPGAGTSIYDAVLLGAKALELRGEERRRVIILVTDAGETTSRTDFDIARKEAVRSDALLYTIVIRPVKNESGRNTAGEHALETITETTGGDMFYPDSPQELDVIFDVIDRELRTQYRLGYYPNPRGPANTYRNVQVKVLNGDYHVRSRKTYLTGAQ
ncbi:MAG: VWA domain-containing protein [Candidatus Acidiferrales bacterium]